MLRHVPLALVSAIATLAVPAAALACGGLFCSQFAPSPVDQTAERIVFEVNGDQITAHVEISYVGEADDFAWVVPVSAVPEIEESSMDSLNMVDVSTRMNVFLPPDPCPNQAINTSSAPAFGCADAGPIASPSSSGGNFGRSSPEEPVQVLAHDYTGNYEYHVVSASDVAELITWLQDNGYNVSDNMTPVMQPYAGPSAKFLALKLRDGRSASDISPISMTYRGSRPMIPLQLTRVAAQPLMGILVIVVADEPYAPVNFAWDVPDVSEMTYDAQRQSSYFAWVAQEAGESGGRFFAAEFHGQQWEPYTERVRWISRLYTRLSPRHMTEDPVFGPVPRSAVSETARGLDFTDRPSLWICGDLQADRVPTACAFNYCGADAVCHDVDGAAACECPEGEVAARITNPDGTDGVSCRPDANPVGVTTDGDLSAVRDPCDSYRCGDAGECVLVGGFPTCRCASGGAARLGSFALDCAPPGPGTTSHGVGGVAPPPDMDEARLDRMLSPDGPSWMRSAGMWLPVLLALLPLGFRRRRR